MKETCQAPVLLTAEGLQVVRGGRKVLDVPLFTLREGEVLALLGPNGAGKTTFLLALASLLEPSAGALRFEGRPVSGNELAYRRQIAMVFQEPLLFEATVRENVTAGLRIRRWERRRIEETADRYLRMLGISHLADRSARKLSGGEARRTSLARALATSPRILFLDEPFSCLDPPAREQLLEDLEGILRKSRTTTVMATHDRAEALRLAESLAVMNEGRVVQRGRLAEVIRRPADALVASYVGVETILAGRVLTASDGVLTVAVQGGRLMAVGRAERGDEVICCLRPEQVTVGPVNSPGGSRNVLRVTIRKITPLGVGHRLLLDCGFPLVAHVAASVLEGLSLSEGKEVTASFEASAVHVIIKGGQGGSDDRPGLCRGGDKHIDFSS